MMNTSTSSLPLLAAAERLRLALSRPLVRAGRGACLLLVGAVLATGLAVAAPLAPADGAGCDPITWQVLAKTGVYRSYSARSNSMSRLIKYKYRGDRVVGSATAYDQQYARVYMADGSGAYMRTYKLAYVAGGC